MFKKILIANRGEIACRVIKTCQRMGIKTVAVYSEADENALHVDMADERVLIGPAASAQSYLVIDKIVQACKDTGAEAVHPGYGFLSENRLFQEALAKEGIVFIGPDAHAIGAMGDKIESKKLAAEAGVNTIPGYMGVLKDADDAVRVAQEVGYPVMIKASAGGGGKGMRVAWNDTEAREGFVSATNEARSSFADDRVFVEKYIQSPRHIEIQVLADGENFIHLFERECSIQRRNQKVIEEAPSPFLTEDVRRKMGEQACALARAVGYKSAGTVEFVADADMNFYFLEMNTRLQVEHPVTEMITGIDLVEWMIRIAAGEKLTLKQEDVSINGWAIESRLYAEDPFRGFLPSIGRLVRFIPPVDEDGAVRVDTGVEEGGEISMYYDPMIAKLITHGQTRDEAIQLMSTALDGFYVQGISHNVPFLAAIMAHPRFREGRLTTNFIAEEYPEGLRKADLPAKDPTFLIAALGAIHRKNVDRKARISGQIQGHEKVPRDHWIIYLGGAVYDIWVREIEGGHRVHFKDRIYTVLHSWRFGEPIFRAMIDCRPTDPAFRNGQMLVVQVEENGVEYSLSHAGTQETALVFTPEAAQYINRIPHKEPPDLSRFLMSPMPGLLMSMAVEEGMEVRAGETLCVIEAMKMENIMKAERDGVISKIYAKPGDSLSVDQKILEFAE
ncbi:acetyl/propionyl/methylcrotonyl-CoA carboxylase subunit alpha [Phaeovibrio sulfidiphilus]|uniref:propionyl-CoA carboxylase n=1 Tax=Phaeovibrio sulfidiphilus TaxID=1220600 RepID=A0A8J6YNY2_9PROT|nr:acetyl/propionyl/methylcrotonyl-CoA carboxylase subunit alpha [Phaeovibrio sulfidiphilus]MBE1236472.1 acetyl/propionyl/methylcrotonyl-CoA carboxylase subunit alpha [Phaeovibrio sulfidiphilus]